MSAQPPDASAITSERAMQAVSRAIDRVNLARAGDLHIGKSADTELLGPGANLDSLGLVNLVVAIEEQIEDEFGVSVNIADEKARSQAESPFKTVGSLVSYICSLISEKTDGR